MCKREAAEDDLRGDLLAFLERFIAKRHGDYFLAESTKFYSFFTRCMGRFRMLTRQSDGVTVLLRFHE